MYSCQQPIQDGGGQRGMYRLQPKRLRMWGLVGGHLQCRLRHHECRSDLHGVYCRYIQDGSGQCGMQRLRSGKVLDCWRYFLLLFSDFTADFTANFTSKFTTKFTTNFTTKFSAKYAKFTTNFTTKFTAKYAKFSAKCAADKSSERSLLGRTVFKWWKYMRELPSRNLQRRPKSELYR
jgi:hypothetical protein